jgi:predicted nucleotide-binding protein
MRAIVWDDKYLVPGQDYMKKLVEELAPYDISFDVAEHASELKSRIRGGEHFDFILTDWLDESSGNRVRARGEDIVTGIRSENKRIPIFIVSRVAEELHKNLLNLGQPIFIESKNTPETLVADSILESLNRIGLRTDPTKVFVMYGRDRHAHGSKEEVVKFVTELGLSPIAIEPWRNQHTLLHELQTRMNECSAFIAICTPDDLVTEGLNQQKKWSQSRQNVLFELGIAFGLARGPERLTILQKWVENDPDQCAVLPSDLDGYVTLKFSNQIRDKFPELEQRLTLLRLKVKTKAR